MPEHGQETADCCTESVLSALVQLLRITDVYREERLTEQTIELTLVSAKDFAKAQGHVVNGTDDLYICGRAAMHFTIKQPEAAKLDGRVGDHIPWLLAKKANLFKQNGYWDNYRRLLELKIPDDPRKRLDEVTDQILDSLEDPSRQEQWDRRGLVMGYVQSGKTANYTGLVCKAIDAGYKVVIVLAGTYNDLRAQTQFRIDEGLIGRDTRMGAASTTLIGVGLEPHHGIVLSLTSASEDGEFKASTANTIGYEFGKMKHPTVLVIKKHPGVLKTLNEWMMANAQIPKGHKRIAGVPLLVIDDEADYASIDTTPDDPDTDPTATNAQIRRLLNNFDQSAYVGYTATPFANIFIDDSTDHAEYGEDLFPRDSIFALQAPTNYIGPETVFGINVAADGTDGPDYPLLNYVEDADDWIPVRHNASFAVVPELFPDSLKRAICSFVLSNAARQLRGMSTEHKSMLIHVTPYVAPQLQVRDQVADYLIDLQNQILYDQSSNSECFALLKEIWETDFKPTAEALVDAVSPSPIVYEFDDIRPELSKAVGSIQVRLLNGQSNDALDYHLYSETGLSSIVVGGAKLSRGLTLEGLSVSYYQRSTKMYDTLMQMGRWFGYRPNYIDLCRIYTSPQVADWYRYISIATRELLDEFAVMQVLGRKPRDFGLKVRHSPGMMVTAGAKMRSAKLLRLSFAGARPETTSFEVSPSRRSLSVEKLSTFLGRLQENVGPGEQPKGEGSDYSWREVEAESVVVYFRSMEQDRLYSNSRSGSPGPIADYIEARSHNDGLVNWTVLLRSRAGDSNPFPIAGLDVGLSSRSHNGSQNLFTYSIKSLIGSQDEAFDLSPEQLEAATELAAKRNPPSDPFGQDFRAVRPTENGLLIIYLLKGKDVQNNPSILDGDPFVAYCVSFPEDPDRATIDYQVNTVFGDSNDE